jgi:DNA adenine methylase
MTAQVVDRKIRPPIKWHGGKSPLARWIIKRLPGHRVYVEPFAGGLNVLLNKPRSPVEVANDLNAELIGLYRVLRDQTEAFLERVTSLEYNAATFAWAFQPGAGDNPMDAALRFLVRHRFSRGGRGKTFAWSKRLRGGQPGDVNAWETIKRELSRSARRLKCVELRCQDAVEIIREYDGPETLFYLDPPYVHETRTARKVYRHEMTNVDHQGLLEAIAHCRGMVVISGYANALYDDALSAWERVERKVRNHSGETRSKQDRVEVLWLSPNCDDDRFMLWG